MSLFSGRASHRGDRGAVAVITAILLSLGILVGMAALVVDVGVILAERERLQSGADAAVMAAAKRCVHDNDCTVSGFAAAAQAAAVPNANDGAVTATVLCGRVGGTQIGACPAEPQDQTRCARTRPLTGDYVEIRTSTGSPGGDTLLPPVFGGAVLGSDYDGPNVKSCARAVWGSLKQTPKAFGFGISRCAFEKLTSPPGVGFAPLDQIKSPFPGEAQEAKARMWTCGNRGLTEAGSLAWLNPPNGDCFRPITAGSDVVGEELHLLFGTKHCKTAGTTKTLQSFFRDYRQPLYLPIYETPPPSLSGTHTYRISGFAYFLPSGFWFTLSNNEPSPVSGDCPGIIDGVFNPCITGFFTKGTISGSVELSDSGPDLGLKAIELVG